MNNRLAVVGVSLVVALGATTYAGFAFQEAGFPHDDHEGLFPVCTGCHEGVEAGDASTSYPEVAICARCHDGVIEEEVSWASSAREVGNVRFDHPEHASDLELEGDAAATCESCHSSPEGGRMSVDASEQLDTCFTCHAHEATEHYQDADCVTCHVPLGGTSLGTRQIDALPLPKDHDRTLFLLETHGRLSSSEPGRCATCHTADRCLSCHVQGALPEIEAIPAAPADMQLPPAAANYPVPQSHIDAGWFGGHGSQASEQGCNTCHTSDDCLTCHVGSVPALVDALPSRQDVRAPGVGLKTAAPESHERLFFMDAHSTLAAADAQSCATCHTASYCVDCHDGPPLGGYHPSNFVSRHAADAFGQADECSTCHNTVAFCRACHVENGFGSEGRAESGYHDAEPLWLLRHGTAARLNLESCASCHEQNQCVQCHGVLGSFKISPHGRDFDAETAWSKSPGTCMACHIQKPVGGT